jgi:hypothetical protein
MSHTEELQARKLTAKHFVGTEPIFCDILADLRTRLSGREERLLTERKKASH